MRRRRTLLAAVLLAALAHAGCNKHHGGAPPHVAHDLPALPGQVQLLVDGKPLAYADRAAAARWSPLTSVLPAVAHDPKAWTILEVHTHAGRITTIPQLAANQPDVVAALFPGDDGIDFGLFAPADLAAHGKPTLVEHDISDVRVKLAKPAAAAGSGSGSGSASGSADDSGDGDSTDSSDDAGSDDAGSASAGSASAPAPAPAASASNAEKIRAPGPAGATKP